MSELRRVKRLPHSWHRQSFWLLLNAVDAAAAAAAVGELATAPLDTRRFFFPTDDLPVAALSLEPEGGSTRRFLGPVVTALDRTGSGLRLRFFPHAFTALLLSVALDIAALELDAAVATAVLRPQDTASVSASASASVRSTTILAIDSFSRSSAAALHS
jgi:hypothetical protein